MKTLLSMVLSFGLISGLFSTAHASWFQEGCANGDASVRTASGHNANYVQYTERRYGQDGMKEKIVRDDEGEIRLDLIEEKSLSSESHNGCVPGQDYGFASWREVSYRKVVLRREDGKPFSKHAVGVSNDLLTITADLICEQDGNSEVMCKKE